MNAAGRFGSPAVENLGKGFLGFKGVARTAMVGLTD